MNMGELAGRLYALEAKVEKLSPSINSNMPTNGTTVPGINSAIGIQLIGLTTAQRVALGVRLALLPAIKYIMVYDIQDQTYYTWSGTEWV